MSRQFVRELMLVGGASYWGAGITALLVNHGYIPMWPDWLAWGMVGITFATALFAPPPKW
jgi:hypothetical protein